MTSSARTVVGLLAGATLLVGCAGEISQSRIERPAADSYFQYGAAPGEMLAVVVGNPFPVAKSAVDQEVVDAMYGAHSGPLTRFATQPGPTARRDYRIIMAFNTPTGFDPNRLCRRTSEIPANSGVEPLQLLAGFCVGDILFSRTKVRAPVMASPADPRFAHMVKTAMRGLVPPHDPFDNDIPVLLLP